MSTYTQARKIETVYNFSDWQKIYQRRLRKKLIRKIKKFKEHILLLIMVLLILIVNPVTMLLHWILCGYIL